jgi:hypothetical protein
VTTVHRAPLVLALRLFPPFASPALAQGPRAALLAAEQARKDTGQTYSVDRSTARSCRTCRLPGNREGGSEHCHARLKRS